MEKMMLNESTRFLIGEFMNLVNVCETDDNIHFGNFVGFTLQDCRETIDEFLSENGYSDEIIAKLWTGEEQLISS